MCIMKIKTKINNMEQVQQEQPVVYPVDATKCKSVEEMGMLLHALGLAMTKEYAEANNLMHLLVETE